MGRGVEEGGRRPESRINQIVVSEASFLEQQIQTIGAEIF